MSLLREICSIALFRGVREKEPLASLCDYLFKLEPGYSIEEMIDSYGHFCSVLYSLRPDCDLSAAIWDVLVDDMNPYLRYKIDSIVDPESAGKQSSLMKLTVQRELELLTRIGSYTSFDLKEQLVYDGYLPDFTSSRIDLKKRYLKMIDSIDTSGYGIFTRYDFFRIKDGRLVPVINPDPVSSADLFCYERQRDMVAANTAAFAQGLPFEDVLLYGDAGTGKSSTVKSSARMFFDKGVRLVEIPKTELSHLSDIIESLSREPMKFILFMDDISFDADDDRIGVLKSVIEGAASGGRRNTAIYATSNRRHMIKETFSSRENEIHRTDTIAEQLSLSERFGIRILFDKPDRKTYLMIVKALLEAKGVSFDDEQIERDAELYALRKGGRSGRTARQFADSL